MQMRVVAVFAFCLLSSVFAVPVAQPGIPFLPDGRTDWDAQLKNKARIPPFSCKPLTPSASRPTDINKLRFVDIDVVASMGDSITAAFGAHDVFKLDGLKEFRGLSWACGGDAKVGNYDVHSLPNFIRRVSPDNKLPKGVSHGTDIPIDALHKNGSMPYHGNPKVDHLNVAQSEAQVQDLPAQVDYLIEQMKKDSSINMEEDWKMLSIMIGANNACGACHSGSRDTPQYYYDNLNLTIAKAQAAIPRLFINLVEMFNTSGVYTQQLTSTYCNYVQTHITECSCMEMTDDDRRKMDEALQNYNDQIEILANEWNSKGLKDFKIVAQPALRNMPIPSREYLSGLDCFHPNQYAHGAFAIGLWNNLQTPKAEKTTTLDPATVVIKCPSDDTYLQ